MEKKSFLLYVDSLTVLDELSDAQAGKLFKAIRAYFLRNAERCYQDGNTGYESLMDDFLTRVLFAPFRAQFERDMEKYDDISDKRREAALKATAVRREKQANGSKWKQKQAKASNCEQTQPIASNCNQLQANDSYNDSDSDINNPPINPPGDAIDPVNDPLAFDTAWNFYDKKIDRKKAAAKWAKLSTMQKEAAIAHIPLYVKSTPDRQFRKNFTTYLNGECWNDEIKQNETEAVTPLYKRLD